MLRPLRQAPRRERGNSSRDYLLEFARVAAGSVPEGALVLDAGAGSSPYAELFAHARYESADFQQVDGKRYVPVTHVCDLREIPVEDGRYDLVLCSQVLEHLPEPLAVLSEFHRVLRDDGQLWITCPLFYCEHEQPYDFYRYTQYGLAHLIEGAGFRVDDLEWLEGFFGTLGYQARYAAEHLPVEPRTYGGGLRGGAYAAVARLARPVLRRSSSVLTGLDLAVRVTDRGMPKNYAAVASKVAVGG
jgi:SAM-dependent methyltransferase